MISLVSVVYSEADKIVHFLSVSTSRIFYTINSVELTGTSWYNHFPWNCLWTISVNLL